MSASRERVAARREALRLKLLAAGPSGATLNDLVDWEPPAGTRDPVRWQYLRRQIALSDLYVLEAEDAAEVIGERKQPWAGRPSLLWAAPAGVPGEIPPPVPVALPLQEPER